MSGSAERDSAGDRNSGLDALRKPDPLRDPVGSDDGHDHDDHIALLYESRAEQFAAVVPFVRQGLADGEHCLYIVDDNSRADVIAALRDGGVDVDAALESGALEIRSPAATYRSDGEFDPDDMVAFLENAVDEAREEYEALRVTGEMTWLLDADVDAEELLEYEGKFDTALPAGDCIALCQYDRDRFPPAVIRDLVKTHPQLVYDGAVCSNLYYTPAAELFSTERASREVDRMLGVLRDRAVATTSLQTHERFLRRLYETIAAPDASFDEKTRRLLDLGREYLDLDVGFLSQIDGEAFEIVDAVGSHELIQPGDTAPVSETYCRRVLESDGPLGVADAAAEGWENDPAYEQYGLESFLGVTVSGGADRYGTLCFADTNPRDVPFTEGQQAFVELMGEWFRHELDRLERERYLRRAYDVTSDTDRSFDEKIDALLELGAERFGADAGLLARDRGDVFEIEAMHGDHPEIAEGATTPASSTHYCREVVSEGETLSVSDAAAAGWTDDPLYEQLGLACYAGVDIAVGDEQYGTICFLDRSPREADFTSGERTFLELIGQWIEYELDRRHREDRLAALNGLSRELMDPETTADIAERVVAAAEDSLNLPVAAVAIDDAETGVLEPLAATGAGDRLLAEHSPLSVGEGVGWKAFVNDEPRRRDDLDSDAGDASASQRVSEIAAFPLGKQGVFLVGATSEGGFSPGDYDFVETVAANVGAAFGRTRREQQLRAREATLEDRTETLGRLERINSIIRNIDQALVGASSRDEIFRVVCEELAADGGPYELAWVGDAEAVSGTVTPVERAGATSCYPEEIEVDVEGGVETLEPAGRALRTGEVQVVDEVVGSPPFESWQRVALERGFQSIAALPLVHGDTTFGVLGVYASEPGMFDELERDVLTELSDTIAYAASALKSKRALVSDEVAELDFAVSDDDFTVAKLTRDAGCAFVHETMVPQADGGLRVFFRTRDAAPEAILDAAAGLSISEVSLVSEREDGGERVCLFEALLAEDCPAATVLDHGGRLTRLRAEDGEAEVTIEIASGEPAREFAASFRSRYPEATLTGKRTSERSRETLTEFHAALTDDLTPRQIEALRTAFHSGYFETPRTRSGSEVAASMDITQPTFNDHLRAGQRKLFGKLFASESGDG
ncbi:MEDS domain-containing protein [Natronoarchaeum mannanilyticum]|uniref:MEDS domain-containing protein n=1 Tax=Natronoarchaeum mannanilyticum TaxID=926360 RepID=UPI0031DA12CC